MVDSEIRNEAMWSVRSLVMVLKVLQTELLMRRLRSSVLTLEMCKLSLSLKFPLHASRHQITSAARSSCSEGSVVLAVCVGGGWAVCFHTTTTALCAWRGRRGGRQRWKGAEEPW